jgi:hypothetical protein
VGVKFIEGKTQTFETLKGQGSVHNKSLEDAQKQELKARVTYCKLCTSYDFAMVRGSCG